MKLRAYRLTSTRFARTAFDGEGARLYGGRWNSIGTRMVYTASSLSLATLELLVHVDDLSTIAGNYTVIPISFDASLVRTVADADLPAHWDSAVPLASTQTFGDKWILDASTAILQIPSAVTPSEKNYLINPAHPDFTKIVIEPSLPFQLDGRLAG